MAKATAFLSRNIILDLLRVSELKVGRVMEQFRGTAVADEEIRLIAPCGSTVDLRDDFLNPRGNRYLILLLRHTISLKHGCVLRSPVQHSLTCCAFKLIVS